MLGDSRRLMLSVTVLIVLAAQAPGGDLNPPVGQVAPTMKRLDAIEPRVCVNDLTGSQDAVHVITGPGHYFLRADVVAPANKDAIKFEFGPGIPTTDLTMIDLNGFSLIGEPGSHHGVHFTATFVNGRYVLRAGVPLRSSGIRGFGGDGVHAEGAGSLTVDGVVIDDCGGDGIDVSNEGAGKFKIDIQGCTVGSCIGDGIRASAPTFTPITPGSYVFQLRASSFDGNGGHGVHLSLSQDNSCSVALHDVRSDNNAGSGARFSWRQVGGPVRCTCNVKSSSFSGNGVDGLTVDTFGAGLIDLDVDLDDVHASDNVQCGIAAGGTQGRSRLGVANGGVERNGADGLNATGTFGGVVRDRFDNIRVQDSDASANGGHGFAAALRAGGPDSGNNLNWNFCSASGNGGNGFDVQADVEEYRHCVADSNGGDGFHCRSAVGLSRSVLKSFFESSATRNTNDGIDIDSAATLGAKNIGLYLAEVTGNGGNGLRMINADAKLKRVACSDNSGHGMHQTGGSFLLNECEFDSNGFGGGGDGVSAEGIDNADAHHTRCRGNARHGMLVVEGDLRVEGSSFNGNGAAVAIGHGLLARDLRDGSIDGVDASRNGGMGFWFESNSGLPCGTLRLNRCRADGNLADGFLVQCSSGGDVRECTATGNGGMGFVISALGHVVVRNTAAGNAMGGYSIAVPGNSVGPLVDEVGIATNESPHANYVR